MPAQTLVNPLPSSSLMKLAFSMLFMRSIWNKSMCLDKGIDFLERKVGHGQVTIFTDKDISEFILFLMSCSTTEKISDSICKGIQKVTGSSIEIGLTLKIFNTGKDLPFTDREYSQGR